MAGSPLKRALRAELERRTRAAWPDEPERTQLDYVAHWQANGNFIKTLAAELNVSPAYLTEYLRVAYGAATVREAMSRAREDAAHILAEDAATTAAEADEDNVQVKRLQVNVLQWLTEKWNRRDFGNAAPGVTINVGSLMLSALQAPSTELAALPASPIAIASAIAEEAIVVSADDAITCESE